MCSLFKIRADNGNHFIGRTMEAPGEYGGYVTVIPRGAKIAGQITRYGFVAMENFGEDNELGLYFDAFNEHGLAISCLALDGCDLGDPQEDSIEVTDAVALVAMSCKDTDEAVTFFETSSFRGGSAADCENADYNDYHWAITDRSGKSVVVEIVEGGQVKIYENDIGVMTNEPTYDQQLALTSALNPKNFHEEKFYPFDLSCEGRFGKLAALNARQLEPIASDLDAVNRAWSMINSVDIPKGALYWRHVSDEAQFTSWSVVLDFKNMIYYFRTYDNMTVQKIDLSKIDFANVPFKRDPLFGAADYQEYTFRNPSTAKISHVA